MSRITLAPNASGTGTLTVAAPNTNTDRTLTLPDVTTTLVGTDATQTLTNKSIAASQLTGALPAIDGSALTGIASMTLLGTLATTSGSSVTLSGLNLTSYKQLNVVFANVSSNGLNDYLYLNALQILRITAAANSYYGSGIALIELVNGSFTSFSGMWAGAFPLSTNLYIGPSGLTTASTSINFQSSTGIFDAGSITIYGVK